MTILLTKSHATPRWFDGTAQQVNKSGTWEGLQLCMSEVDIGIRKKWIKLDTKYSVDLT